MLKDKKKRRNQNQDLFEYNIKFLSFYLKAQSATSSPPLSSILGNYGLQSKKFCDEFNNLTANLIQYFLIKVFVKIDLNLKTWSLHIGKVPITYLFKIIAFSIKRKFAGYGGFFFKEFFCITMKNFFLVILFINNGVICEKDIINKLSIVQSMNMLILDEEKNVIINL